MHRLQRRLRSTLKGLSIIVHGVLCGRLRSDYGSHELRGVPRRLSAGSHGSGSMQPLLCGQVRSEHVVRELLGLRFGGLFRSRWVDRLCGLLGGSVPRRDWPSGVPAMRCGQVCPDEGPVLVPRLPGGHLLDRRRHFVRALRQELLSNR